MKTYKGYIGQLDSNQVFCFGSNPEGRHGAGTAKIAVDHYGAKWKVGRGLMGQSYGLVTKNLRAFFYEVETGIEYELAGRRSVSIEHIEHNIKELYEFAIENPEMEFFIAYTPYGKLLNGYTIEEMAKMFCCINIPDNIVFNEDFIKLF
jgi:hypothetical protein